MDWIFFCVSRLWQQFGLLDKLLSIFHRIWITFQYISFFPFFCHQSWLLHLWSTNWCKWPYWSLDCDARLVKLLLNMKLSAYYQLYPLYYNLNVLAVYSFESLSVENIKTAKTDVSNRVGFCPHCSKKRSTVGSLQQPHPLTVNSLIKGTWITH